MQEGSRAGEHGDGICGNDNRMKPTVSVWPKPYSTEGPYGTKGPYDANRIVQTVEYGLSVCYTAIPEIFRMKYDFFPYSIRLNHTAYGIR